jgi:hypothetical protein
MAFLLNQGVNVCQCKFGVEDLTASRQFRYSAMTHAQRPATCELVGADTKRMCSHSSLPDQKLRFVSSVPVARVERIEVLCCAD